MYDALTTRYTFGCPSRGETHVRLSAFRMLDRLAGTAHPASIPYTMPFVNGFPPQNIG